MNLKKFTLAILSILFAAGTVSGQTVYRIRMADSSYTCQLRGLQGKRTAEDTIAGSYVSVKDYHEFQISTTGQYELWVDAAGGSNYSQDTGWKKAGNDGKAIPGSDFADLWEKINTDEELLNAAYGDTSITTDKIMPQAVTSVIQGDSSISAVKIKASVIVKAKFDDEDWGDVSVSSNVVSLDSLTVDTEELAEEAVSAVKTKTYTWMKVQVSDILTEQTLTTSAGNLTLGNLDSGQAALPDFAGTCKVEIVADYQDRTGFITTDPSITQDEVTFGFTLSPAGNNGGDGNLYFDIIVEQL